MNEEEIQKFIAQTEKDLELARSFLDMWQRRNAKASPASTVPPKEIQPALFNAQTNGKNNLEIVREAVAKCAEEYSVYDVERAMHESGHTMDRHAISRVLSTLFGKGEIMRKSKGIQQMPSVYTKRP